MAGALQQDARVHTHGMTTQQVPAMASEHHPTKWYLKMEPGAKNGLWAALSCYAAASMIIHMLLLAEPGIAASFDANPDDVEEIFSWTLWTSAFGGWFFGRLADRVGRALTLRITVAWMTVSALLCACAQNLTAFSVLHAIMGFGFGGVWAAGAVLVGEWANPADRGKTVGAMQSGWAVGWGFAIVLNLLLNLLLVNNFALPLENAWRWVFGLGLAPVALVYFVWRFVGDAPVFLNIRSAGTRMSILTLLRNERAIIRTELATLREKIVNVANLLASIFNGPDARRQWLQTMAPSAGDESLVRRWLITFGLSTGALTGYYVITRRLAPFLSPGQGPAAEAWRDGFLIAGSVAGYLVSAWVSDRLGRHPGFFVFAVGAFVTVVFCTLWPPVSNVWVALALILVGFFASGVFSGNGAFLTELYPTRIRGEMQGANYSFGRRFAYTHWLVHLPTGCPIVVVVLAAYALVIGAVWQLPETRGRDLNLEAEDRPPETS
jgi:MFS family permease